MRVRIRPFRRALVVVAAAVLASACRHGFAAYYQKARAAYDDQNYIETIDALQLGLPKWRDSDGTETKAQAYQLLGLSYHHLRNTDKAIAAFRQAIQLSSSTYDSAASLGLLMLAKGQHEAALEAFHRALDMKPGDPQALLGLGNSLYMLHRPDEARAAFNGVLDNSPAVRDAMEGLAVLDHPAVVPTSNRPRRPRTRRMRR